MTRQEKVIRARALRAERKMTYREIGEVLGMSRGAAAYYGNRAKLYERKCLNCGETFEPGHGHALTCSPECRAAHENKRKRDWENKERLECSRCGQPTKAGSAARKATGPNKPSVRCAECVIDEARRRTARFIALRKEGLLNMEIAEVAGGETHAVATTLSRAWRYGLEVPPSLYYRGKQTRNGGKP